MNLNTLTTFPFQRPSAQNPVRMIRIKTLSTTPPDGLDRSTIQAETRDLQERLAAQHELLRATKSHSLLVIFQGMDAAGKDGAVKNVFKACPHLGIRSYSWGKPTEEEFAHDFLWRIHRVCPAKGEVVIFNRSHYEDVLIQRVHHWIDAERVDLRYRAINTFEQLLEKDANTLVCKYFLHLSYDEQRKQLQERIDEREKHYKHNPNDWREREHWDAYMDAYEDMLNRTEIPWTVVPVDKRWYRNYVILKDLVPRLEALHLEYPELEADD